ncbi:hypothetical protein RJT34_18967 [Clitoria ternatea]|uniref:C2H2-type domain-containing protein n=1 Tax=Clitoria ternatea TaxID=43366 RepID=A0AAN9P2Z1_CLITE
MEFEGFESIDLANCLMLLSGHQQRNFECKTCNRKFPSFQALGGHRASHSRSKLDGDELKTHAVCSICGQQFSLGQALGGHMRRHRTLINQHFSSIKQVVTTRVIMCFDLNLTPIENDVNLFLGKVAPNVGAFF